MVRAARTVLLTLLAILPVAVVATARDAGGDGASTRLESTATISADAEVARLVAEESRADAEFARREAAFEKAADAQLEESMTHVDCFGRKVYGEIPRDQLVWEKECPAIREAKRRADAALRRKREARERFLAGGPPTIAQLEQPPGAGCDDRQTCPLLEVRAENAAAEVASEMADPGRASGVYACHRQSPWRFVCDYWTDESFCGRWDASVAIIQPRSMRDWMYRHRDLGACRSY